MLIPCPSVHRSAIHALSREMFFNSHEVNVVPLLITVIVITGFIVGRKIARYFGV